MWVIKYKKFFITFSLLLVVASLVSILTFGLKLGTDFRGGAILEVSYQTGRPSIESVSQNLKALDSLELGEATLQLAGSRNLILRLREITDEEKGEILAALSQNGELVLEEERFSSIGPSLGRELYRKGIIALVLVVLLIILYITFAFRKVSHAGGGSPHHGKVNSWKYGIIAVVALFHDVLIPTGVFVWLGHYWGIEIDALFLTALLTILGLSVNDTIVVFDRIRENLKNKVGLDFGETVGKSLEQTFMRSLNTSLTIALVLLALFVLGGSATKNFTLVLLLGTIIGTYSSIFLASPLLVVWQRWSAKKAA